MRPISYNPYVTWLLTSNFHTRFFSYLYWCSKALFYEAKKTLTMKQILIFLEAAIHRCSQKACNFNKKRFQHMCFAVKFAKFFRTLFFTDDLRWLLLLFLKQKSKNDKTYLHKQILFTGIRQIFTGKRRWLSFLGQLQAWEHIVLRKRDSILDIFMKFVTFYRILFVH